MARPDPHIAAHLEWIGFVRPTGLVVSPPALVHAGVVLDRRDAEGQRLLNECIEETDDGPILPDFRDFAERVLDWQFVPEGYAGAGDVPIPPELELTADDGRHVLRPTFAVRGEIRRANPAPSDDAEVPAWQLLVIVLDRDASFDQASRSPRGGLEASPHSRLERLLRHSGAPAGLLFNGMELRLLSAPRGESAGWLDFRVQDMRRADGRPICTAMRALLRQQRLLTVPPGNRLAALLAQSRRFQNQVSERLSEQVLHALYELLRGFQAAHDASRGELLKRPLAEDPDHVYRGLLTVVLRLVFLLYAEERDMLPQDETYLTGYSLASLYERLREDAAHHPDTMDQRYGAWAQLIALWRMVHDGAKSGAMALPARHGELFDPNRYAFLEARDHALPGQGPELLDPPLVPDGTIHRVLEKLIVLDGDRISYRALDVEHVGAVYETMMGFRLETATGRTVAIKAMQRHGAPSSMSLDHLLDESASARAKWVKDRTDRRLTDRVRRAVQASGDIESLHAALEPVVDRNATPDLVHRGAMVLQPSEERRRSGSHYTPRELTEPIVRTTLEPVLDRLREDSVGPPRAQEILSLKVCDPAMGSGAFLVETCRQLADALIEAWHAYGDAPDMPPDEDEILFARRMVARRCLYGVDRNPAAVDLAKLSLWLVTLAKDHPLTFLNHALRHGDSLVGLSRRQIRALHWKQDSPVQAGIEQQYIREHLRKAGELREQVRAANEDTPDSNIRRTWEGARDEAATVSRIGDLLLEAFFDAATAKGRERNREKLAGDLVRGRGLDHHAPLNGGLVTFHWEVEFPEVFDRDNPGFDAFVGNPPYAGQNTVRAANPAGYPKWLKELHPGSHGNADLVAHFFRRTFWLLRDGGTLGLIATNTIAQGDTRNTGLRWICEHGGEIYQANRRYKWPGQAAVVVSVLHIRRGSWLGLRLLDGKSVDAITAFLAHRGGHRDPARLRANKAGSFSGVKIYGQGFTFDDTDTKGLATPLATMRGLLARGSKNVGRVFPYVGGEEVNVSPTHAHHRYVINFESFPLGRADVGESWQRATSERRRELLREPIVPIDYPHPVASDWPELLAIVEEKVKPSRAVLAHKDLRERWWQYARRRPALYAAITGLRRVLGNSCVSNHLQFTFVEPNAIWAHSLNIFPLASDAALCALQSRPHEIWARFFGSSMKDDLRYTPSDCFETFPFPEGWETHRALEAAGSAYYDFRATLMVDNDQGMTTTYNRFHDPYEHDPEIVRLREMHAAMDRAVLDAYGWQDIPTDCEFLLDYPIDEAEWGRKKKPYRYRWPDEVRDEVLARLLELNARRHAEELSDT